VRLAIALVAVLAARTAGAAIFTIADGDVAGLIAAMNTANANGEDDTINLAPGSTYSVMAVDNGQNGLPLVTSRMTIVGSAMNGGIGSTITRSPLASSFRLFEISTTGDLTLDHVWVTRGRLSSSIGGGICVNGGKLALTNVFVNDCTCTSCQGGGLFIVGSAAVTTITDSTFSNDAAAVGGAIDVQQAASVTLTRSRLVSNLATAASGAVHGAGIAVESPTTIGILETTLGGNLAFPDAGGADGSAIADHGGATWTIVRSTLTDNNVTVPMGSNGFGGGIADVGGGTFTLTNTTISGNSVLGNGSGRAEGGGIAAVGGGTWTLNNVTIADNSVSAPLPVPAGAEPDVRGGGIDLVAGSFHLRNTIVADNSSTDDAEMPTSGPDCYTRPIVNPQTLVSEGYDLVESTTDCTIAAGPGDLTGVDPMLGVLTVSVGPTAFQPLLPQSPAVDAGSPSPVGTGGDACEVSDQRCFVRPAGMRCDIGAFESNSFAAPDCDVATPTTSTTSTTSSTTTSTTAPPCVTGPDYQGLGCRLDALLARLTTASDLGRMQDGLIGTVITVRARTQQAGAFNAAGKAKAERRALRKTITKLRAIVHRLRSPAAQKVVPPATRTSLLADATAILQDTKRLLD
jgi:hypothetical protein